MVKDCPCQRDSAAYEWDAYEKDVEGIPICSIYGQCEIVFVPSFKHLLDYPSIDGIYKNPRIHQESFEATDTRWLRAINRQLVCYPSKVAGSGLYQSPNP